MVSKRLLHNETVGSIVQPTIACLDIGKAPWLGVRTLPPSHGLLSGWPLASRLSFDLWACVPALSVRRW